MLAMLFILFTLNHSPENKVFQPWDMKKLLLFMLCRYFSSFLGLLCHCNGNTVQAVLLLKVCNTVKPSFVFHTGGMFVIPINVSIFRM